MSGPNDTLDLNAARADENAAGAQRHIGSLAAAIAAIATETGLLALTSVIDAVGAGSADAAARAAMIADEVTEQAAQLEHEVSRLLGTVPSADAAG
ncbi:MAG TPA: hypothetical protein VJJ77_13080 [Dongiaceae bacterium]|nr:hypothetical protein [Dongiaceae bacterium]